MSPTEAAWLAGFFDGEGSISTYLGGRLRSSPCWLITCSNTHLGALERCKEYAGCGTVGYKQVRPEHKPQWQWRVHARADVIATCEQMLPYLIIKREAVTSFLATQLRNVAQ